MRFLGTCSGLVLRSGADERGGGSVEARVSLNSSTLQSLLGCCFDCSWTEDARLCVTRRCELSLKQVVRATEQQLKKKKKTHLEMVFAKATVLDFRVFDSQRRGDSRLRTSPGLGGVRSRGGCVPLNPR